MQSECDHLLLELVCVLHDVSQSTCLVVRQRKRYGLLASCRCISLNPLPMVSINTPKAWSKRYGLRQGSS